MPDLLGPWRSEGWDDAVNSLHQKWQGLGIISADAAKYPAMLLVVEDVATALLEALKAGGVKVEATPDNDDNWGVSWAWAASTLEARYDNQLGHIIFIPEAQE